VAADGQTESARLHGRQSMSKPNSFPGTKPSINIKLSASVGSSRRPAIASGQLSSSDSSGSQVRISASRGAGACRLPAGFSTMTQANGPLCRPGAEKRMGRSPAHHHLAAPLGSKHSGSFDAILMMPCRPWVLRPALKNVANCLGAWSPARRPP
jgi:hypothetical protein